MSKKNIIEYLKDKGELKRVAPTATSFKHLRRAERLLNKSKPSTKYQHNKGWNKKYAKRYYDKNTAEISARGFLSRVRRFKLKSTRMLYYSLVLCLTKLKK